MVRSTSSGLLPSTPRITSTSVLPATYMSWTARSNWAEASCSLWLARLRTRRASARSLFVDSSTWFAAPRSSLRLRTFSLPFSTFFHSRV